MSLNKKHVLIVGGKDFTMQGLSSLNVAFSLIQKPKDVTSWQRSNAHTIIEMEYEAVASCPASVMDLHQEYPFSAVFSFTEFGLLPASLIARDLELDTNCDKSAVEMTRNKYMLRKKLEVLNGFSVPCLLTANIEEAKQFLATQASGVIIKPISGAGSVGVFYAANTEDLEAAFDSRTSTKESLLLERFIEGDEFSVESISKSGSHEILAITKKTTTGSPHFVELGHQQPAPLNNNDKQKIMEFCTTLLNFIGHKNGPCHTELKLDNGHLYLIETQTRNGGDNIWDMTRITTGADLFLETYAHVLAIPFVRQDPLASCSEIRYFNCPAPDTETLHRFSSHRAVKQIQWNDNTFNLKQKLTSSYDRSGFLMAAGSTIYEIQSIINEFSKSINYNG